MNISTYIARTRLFLVASATISVVSLVAVASCFAGGKPDQDSASARVAIAINDETAKLNIKPRTIELTSEKAMRVRNAIKREDYSVAKQITADIVASSRLQNWRYYPFSDFISGIADVNDPTFEAHLDAWVMQSNNDAIPLLIRAQYYHDMGWFKRGPNFVRDTQVGHMASFEDYMKKAVSDIDTAIRLNDENPYGFYLKLRILRGFGLQQNLKSVFEDAIVKHPDYYQLYDVVLGVLEPKWGGSVADMYAFVDQYAGRAVQYSPLKLLYVSLYRHLLGSAATACISHWPERNKMAECVASGMQKTITPELGKQVLAALQLYDHSDAYQFGVAMDEILLIMLSTTGGDTYSGAMLQLAASSMHSDTQLKADKPGRNNYIIDKAVAESWYVKGFYDNALKKDQDALKDIEAAEFPSEEEKDRAIAAIYQHIGKSYSSLHQYPEMIAYAKAAIALGGRNGWGHFICYGYYQLKDYDDAVQACTETIENETANVKALYWRGSAYRDSGQIDAALRDLIAVADSEDSFRTSAAIDVSMIYFNRDDVRGALNALNKYTYLYSPDANSRDNMAVSYNNRCYAYMQLGQLKEALDDCTKSLRYGSLPDAYRKQQELVKRLEAP
jgi:tetratricopeptide (TPR) repeat protein